MPLVRHWPPGHPRILVADAWLANAGDGAIAIATQQRLERLAPGAAIVHAAYQGDLLAAGYPELDLVPPLAGLLGVTPRIPEMRTWDSSAAASFVAAADVVMSQGGGFAMEHYDPWERIRAWELVAYMGLPLGFGAQSVGRFARPRERAALRRAYGAAEVVAVREELSRETVIELGATPERVLVTADEVFSLEARALAADPSARRGLACVLSEHPQQREDGSWAAPRSPRELAVLVRRLLRAAEHVTLFSTQQGLGGLGRGLEDDAELSARVVSMLPRSDAARVRLLRTYLPPHAIGTLVGAHRGLVSMRMHAAIIALGQRVPTLLLNESFKVTAMFAMLGLEDALGPEAGLRGRPPSLAIARERAAANDEVVRRLLAAAPPPASTGRAVATDRRPSGADPLPVAADLAS